MRGFCSPVSEELSRSSAHNSVTYPLSASVEEGAESRAKEALAVTAERGDLLLRLNDYMVYVKSLVRILSKHDVILKEMTASLKPLERKVRSSENEKRLLEATNEVLMRKYDEETPVVWRCEGKLEEIRATHFVRMAKCISRSISKWSSRKVSELKNVYEDLQWNYTGSFDRSSLV